MGPLHLNVAWHTEDPELAALLSSIESMPEGSRERLVATAVLHEWCADLLREELGRASPEAVRTT